MSDTENQNNDVLLPASGVAVFARDKELLENSEQLATDWRFARVMLSVRDGDVDTAIAEFQDRSAPAIVIVQTDDVSDAFLAKLEELANYCDENTNAIIIGPVNDVDLYRNLIDMGVSDYLVRPVSQEKMANVIAKTLIDHLGVTGSRLITYVGAKGGVGTSALAQAAAWGVADNFKQKTLILDSAGGWSSNSVGLGYEPATTMAEAVRAAQDDDEDNLERMLHKAHEKLNVLATGGDTMLDDDVMPEQFEWLLDMLMQKYPVIVADLSSSPPGMKKMLLARATQINIVSTAALPSLRLARSLIQEVSDLRGGEDDAVELIINMKGFSSAHEASDKDIEEALDRKPSVALSFDPKLFMGSESESKKVTENKAGADLMQASILPLLSKVLGDSGVDTNAAQGEGILDQVLGKLGAK